MERVQKLIVIPSKNRTINRENEEWRKDLDSMPKKWATMLKTNSKRFPHDIIFSLKGKTFSCHKLVISVASPFFEDLIVEAEKLKQNVIEVTEMDPTAFSNMLQYVYQDENLIIAEQDLAATMSVAQFFELRELENLCSKRLHHTLSNKTAVTIYQVANGSHNDRIRKMAYRLILKNFRDILDSEDFLGITNDNLCEILKSKVLNVESETAVVKGVVRWGEHQCELRGKEKTYENVRKILAEVRRYICMRAMSFEDFVSVIGLDNLFNGEERIQLIRYLQERKGNKDANLILKGLKMSTFPRLHISHTIVNLLSDPRPCKEVVTDSFEYYNSINFMIDGDERDRSIFLEGIGFRGRPSQPTEKIDMTVKVIDHAEFSPDDTVTSDMAPTLSKVRTIYTAEANKISMIDFNKSIRISPNQEYTVCYGTNVGGLAVWKDSMTDFILFKENDYLKRPVCLTVSQPYGIVCCLKFSHFEDFHYV